MSILRSLIKLFDPVEERKIAEELKRKRETLPGDEESGDDPEQSYKVDPYSPREKKQTLRCRVCGFEGEKRFCPQCLAETMQPH